MSASRELAVFQFIFHPVKLGCIVNSSAIFVIVFNSQNVVKPHACVHVSRISRNTVKGSHKFDINDDGHQTKVNCCSNNVSSHYAGAKNSP